MLPSPSLGPPLLSGSWSPPLPCGMGLAGGAGAVVAGAGAVVAGAGAVGEGGGGGVVTGACVGAEWCGWAAAAGLAAACCAVAAVPQPAARTASSAAPAADRMKVGDMTILCGA